MSKQQLDDLSRLLRNGPLDLAGDVNEQRAIFAEMIAAVPMPEDVMTETAVLGGVPVVEIDVPGVRQDQVILYLHGGAYAIGSAASSIGLASELARRAGARAVSVDYRLAPEHPHPAAVNDAQAAYSALLDEGFAASQIVIAGESAGAGLVAATLLAIKASELPQPCAALMMSPWVDLTLSGETIESKAAVDPILTAEGLAVRAADYVGDGDPQEPLISPLFGDLSELAPMLIQAGSHEILLSDATRLASAAAAADVGVTLEVTAGAPHVFQGFAATLQEGQDAVISAAAFLNRHLTLGQST